MALTEEQKKAVSETRALITGSQGSKPTSRREALIEKAKAIGEQTEQPSFGEKVVSYGKGIGKGLAEEGFETASLLQTAGQGFLAAVDPTRTFSEVREDTGFEMLKGEKADEIREMLKGDNTAEKAGKLTAFLATMLTPSGSRKAVQKGFEVAGDVAKPITEAIGKGATNIVGSVAKPEEIMQRVIRLPKSAQVKFQKMAGESEGEYLTKRGIFGDEESVSRQLFERFTASKNEADKALGELKGTFKPTAVKNALTQLMKRETSVSAPGALSKDFTRTRELFNKFNKEGLSMTETNEVKRLFERNVKLDFLRENKAKEVELANNIDNAIRKWQVDQATKLGLSNLPEINKETQLAKQLMDEIGKQSAGQGGNNLITLSDWVILAGGDPTAIGAFLGKKALSSKKLQSGIARKLAGKKKVDLPKAIKKEPKPGLLEFLKKTR